MITSLAYILLGVLTLATVAVIGWFIVSPVIDWVGEGIFVLSVKGHEYRTLVKHVRSGDPCCTTCDGFGVDVSSPETNGKCWDCRGTGHPHPLPA